MVLRAVLIWLLNQSQNTLQHRHVQSYFTLIKLPPRSWDTSRYMQNTCTIHARYMHDTCKIHRIRILITKKQTHPNSRTNPRHPWGRKEGAISPETTPKFLYVRHNTFHFKGLRPINWSSAERSNWSGENEYMYSVLVSTEGSIEPSFETDSLVGAGVAAKTD